MAEPSLAPCSGCANTTETAVAGFCRVGPDSDDRHLGAAEDLVDVVRSRSRGDDMEEDEEDDEHDGAGSEGA